MVNSKTKIYRNTRVVQELKVEKQHFNKKETSDKQKKHKKITEFTNNELYEFR